MRMRELGAGPLGDSRLGPRAYPAGLKGSHNEESLEATSVVGADWRLKLLVGPHLHQTLDGLWPFLGEKAFESNVHGPDASRLYGAHPLFRFERGLLSPLKGRNNTSFLRSVEESGHLFLIESKDKHKSPHK